MVTRAAPILLALLLTGCASSVPPDLLKHAQETCQLYQEMRPDVIAAREIIVAGFDLFPPKTQEALRRIDRRLPQLDQIGRYACNIASAPQGFDWKQAETILREVAPYVALLKQSGVIG